MAQNNPRIVETVDHVVIEPMSVNIGAEIGGVDLTQPLSAQEVDTIRQALLDWKVIFFRDQNFESPATYRFCKELW